ncbi:MAG: hypothetical protein PHH77_09275 [Victivallaceae bacterium]|nr:hypothetical protein [Victivallaceae bacterium]
MKKKITGGIAASGMTAAFLLAPLTGKAQDSNPNDSMPVPPEVVRQGENRLLFPDNFSNPYNKLHPNVKSRTVHFIQNDAQPQMVTKVYTLKYLRASDITPFVLGAARRFTPQSHVERLNYKHGQKQFLVVSTGQQMMPYIDKMIEQLDRPGLKDQVGSLVSSTGITRGAYRPQYRSGDDFVSILNKSVVGQGYVWNNEASNIIYWKTDHYHSEEKVRHWLKYMDRPLPQIRLTFKIYEIRESDLMDLGIDYNAWKNGPGLNIFNFSFQDLFTKATEEIFNTLINQGLSGTSSFAWGGIFFAPSFDMSFIRLLSQRGAANVAATGTLTVVNDYTGSYPITMAPEYENIQKGEQDQTDVVTSPAENAKFTVTVRKPVICLRQNKKQEFGEYNYTRFSPETYDELGSTVIFGFNLTMNTPVERNNFGQQLLDTSKIDSSITLNLGTEKLLGCYDTQQEIEQTIGAPWLSDIPYLKYIFGTTTTIKLRNRFFVTVRGELVHPDTGNRMAREFSSDIALAEKTFAPKPKPKMKADATPR